MKINRKERILLIEVLEKSIEEDKQVLEDTENLDADTEGELSVAIEAKQELMMRLGEPIGYFVQEEDGGDGDGDGE